MREREDRKMTAGASREGEKRDKDKMKMITHLQTNGKDERAHETQVREGWNDSAEELERKVFRIRRVGEVEGAYAARSLGLAEGCYELRELTLLPRAIFA